MLFIAVNEKYIQRKMDILLISRCFTKGQPSYMFSYNI